MSVKVFPSFPLEVGSTFKIKLGEKLTKVEFLGLSSSYSSTNTVFNVFGSVRTTRKASKKTMQVNFMYFSETNKWGCSHETDFFLG